MRTVRNLLLLLVIVSMIACGGGGGGGGNASSPPNPPTADTNPPTISNLQVQPSLLTAGSSATIQATVGDDRSGVATVLAMITYPDSRQESIGLSLAQGVYQGTFVARWDGRAGRIRVLLRAADQAGNLAERETTVNAAGTPPSPP
ncbi:MAG: hypothetical protein NZ550_00160 [Fimbriimonadales bacterium]|nr:hypothetical protein [Fimbriimonadales bacterium]MDW8052237.1 hypothetical protein [Armatimonadota bacterium]